jgi:hypothetical protein
MGEEGVGVFGTKAEKAEGAEASGRVGDEHELVVGVADGEDGRAGERTGDLVGGEREGERCALGLRRASRRRSKGRARG